LGTVDGVSETNSPDPLPQMQYITPEIDTSEGRIKGPVYANRVLLQEARLNQSVPDAAKIAHQRIRRQWPNHRPREMPQNAALLTDLEEHPQLEGRDQAHLPGVMRRWADVDGWVMDERGLWTRVFDREIWTPDMLGRLDKALDFNQRLYESGVLTEEQRVRWKKYHDRSLKDSQEVWINSVPIGRYDGDPMFDEAKIAGDWEMIRQTTDGAEIDEDNIANWLDVLKAGPVPNLDPKVQKTVDDWGLVIAKREPFTFEIGELRAAGLTVDDVPRVGPVLGGNYLGS
jgi:hypothetical protein